MRSEEQQIRTDVEIDQLHAEREEQVERHPLALAAEDDMDDSDDVDEDLDDEDEDLDDEDE